MVQAVIVGGGFAGCAAAVSARKAGAQVTLVERMDELLGTGLVGGIMRNNGRFTAAEEAIAMGGGGMVLTLLDSVSHHKNVAGLPGHNHTWYYHRLHAEPVVRKALLEMGIEIYLGNRMVDVETQKGDISTIRLEDGTILSGDAFVDTTGTTGPMGLCKKHGNGCVMCIMRCTTYGGRVGVAEKAGVREIIGRRQDGKYGAMSGGFDVYKESLDPALADRLSKEGVLVLPMPEALATEDQMKLRTCVQYALKSFGENLVISDNGFAKVHASHIPLHVLRQIPGFERAHISEPAAGGRGNSIRFLAMAPRDNTLQVKGVANLFCAGEKAGLFVGHTEAIVTGSLAGHNAVRRAAGKEPLELPGDTVLGDMIAFVNEKMQTEEGLANRYTFSGAAYFQRMKELGTYTADVEAVRSRVRRQGLYAIFDRQIG